MIIARTPMRVSLFGGGSDYPAHFLKHGGAVLGFACDKYVYTTVRWLPPFFDAYRHRVVYSRVELCQDVKEIQHPLVRAVLTDMPITGGLEIHHDADLPHSSGMGSSSAFAVGLLQAMRRLLGDHDLDREALAREATVVEQELLGEAVGNQDQVWAAYGGFNAVTFARDRRVYVTPVSPVYVGDEIARHCVLYFTGHSRIAGKIAATQVARAGQNEKTLMLLHSMVQRALDCLHVPREIGAMLNDAWQIKRELAPNITTPEIDEMYEAGLRAGAWGGKLLGAGGGGFMLFMAPPERRDELHKAMNGRIEIRVRVDREGSKLVLAQPNGL